MPRHVREDGGECIQVGGRRCARVGQYAQTGQVRDDSTCRFDAERCRCDTDVIECLGYDTTDPDQDHRPKRFVAQAADDDLRAIEVFLDEDAFDRSPLC